MVYGLMNSLSEDMVGDGKGVVCKLWVGNMRFEDSVK